VNDPAPAISVIVPIRNEAPYILHTVASIMQTDFPLDHLEILLVDGMSDDGTPEIVRDMPKTWPIRLIENPNKSIPAGMNCGIREARAEYIVRMDAHSEYPTNYIRRSIEILKEVGASNVGGYLIPQGRHYRGKAIAAALASKFGAGSSFWSGAKAQYATTVAYGAWRTEFLIGIGGFDEEWTTNQDYELNTRTIEQGGSVYFSPEISCIYYCRESFLRLRRQFHNYGKFRAKTLQRYPQTLNIRHMAPPALVLAFAVFALLTIWTVTSLVFLTLVYLAALGLFAADASAKSAWKYFPAIALAIGVLHVSWGIGFISGILHFGIPRIGIRTILRTLRATVKK